MLTESDAYQSHVGKTTLGHTKNSIINRLFLGDVTKQILLRIDLTFVHIGMTIFALCTNEDRNKLVCQFDESFEWIISK